MTDIAAPASGRYTAAHNSGVRRASQIRNVCIHSTEGGTAQGAAAWFSHSASGGSAHMVCDDTESYRTLPDLMVAWAAPGLNVQGYHIELAGSARLSRGEWLGRRLTLERAAYKAALRCKRYGVPARWVGPVGLRLGRRGLTTHRAVSYAWPILAWRAGFHTDPGTGFPRDVFLTLVRRYLAAL